MFLYFVKGGVPTGEWRMVVGFVWEYWTKSIQEPMCF